MKRLIVVLLVIYAGVLIACISRDEISDLDLEQRHYCEMVELYASSNGDKGWPDFENSYATSCKHSRGVNVK